MTSLHIANHDGANVGPQGDFSSHTHYHYPARPETSPSPSCAIPFARDDDFIDRGTLLAQIHEKCAAPASRVALVGLGGVGKSQLAIEYSHQAHYRSAETWVFWVHASNAARFEQSYRDIADRVKMFGRQDPTTNIFKLVHDWLCSSKARWLLVLDNVDDARFLLVTPIAQQNEAADSKSVSKPLRSYIPQSERGSVLITTRTKEAARELVDRRNIISVQPMNKIQASALLKKKLEGDKDIASIDELALALEYMPLAIVQAAAYIAKRAPRCSVQQYLADFQRSDRKKMALFTKEVQFREELRRDYDAKNSIIITWQISFEHIHETRQSAADLLSLMSFFDRQSIPEKLLRTRPEMEYTQQERDERCSKRQAREDEDSTSQSSSDDDRFEDDIQTLRDYSFISINADDTSFEMHRLVQLATQNWLQTHHKLEQWKFRFIGNLCDAYPEDPNNDWAVCQNLRAHVKSAVEQRPEGKESLRKWALLLDKASLYALELGNWIEAEAMSVQSMKTREKILGLDHKDTLWSMTTVGEVYYSRGRWEEASALQKIVMEISKTKLGADHIITRRSMASLAAIYLDQGLCAEAEALKNQVIESSRTKDGADDPFTLTSMADLALTYMTQGKFEEANALFTQVIENYKTKPEGADHPRPDTLASMVVLGLTYKKQHRLEEAKALYMQVIESSKRTLGADHPLILGSMYELAHILKRQGLIDQAIPLLEDCFKREGAVLGSQHPSTLTTGRYLAVWRIEQHFRR